MMKKSYQHNFTKMAKGKRPGCRVSIKARMKTSMGNFDGWNIRIDGDLDKKFYRNQADVEKAVRSALIEWEQLREEMYAEQEWQREYQKRVQARREARLAG